MGGLNEMVQYVLTLKPRLLDNRRKQSKHADRMLGLLTRILRLTIAPLRLDLPDLITGHSW